MKNKINLIDTDILESIAASFLSPHIPNIQDINKPVINSDKFSVTDVSNRTSFNLKYYDFPYLNTKLDTSAELKYMNYKDIFKKFDLDVNFYYKDTFISFLNKIINSSFIFTLRCCNKSKEYTRNENNSNSYIRFLTLAYMPENNKILIISDFIHKLESKNYSQNDEDKFDRIFNQGACGLSDIRIGFIFEKDVFINDHGPFSSSTISLLNTMSILQDNDSQNFRIPVFTNINNYLFKLLTDNVNLHKYDLNFKDSDHKDLDICGECYICNNLISQLTNTVSYINEIESFNSVIHYKNLVLSSSFLNEYAIDYEELFKDDIEKLKLEFDEAAILYNNICGSLSREKLDKIKKGDL